MGTSTSNPGPTSPPPLLPPWACDPPDADGDPPGSDPEDANPGDSERDGDAPAQPAVPPTTSWKSPRTLIGNVASGRVGGQRGRDNVRTAVSRSVSAMGSARAAARSSPAGRRSAARFAAFLAGVSENGGREAARAFGVEEFLGRGADVFLVGLADALAPAGALTEDAIARDAMDDTLQELFDDLGVTTGGIEALERMTPVTMASAVVRYAVNYIYARVIHALTAHIHARSETIARMRDIERMARNYIEDAVRVDVDTSAVFADGGITFAGRWDAGEGQRVINRLFEECYSVVEAGLDRGGA